MDPYDFPVTRSPRKELQGPRPPALKLHKDSHKIRKPPIAPSQQPSHQQPYYHHHQQPQQTQPRPPVIIYTVSPKVIHTNPSDFMNLVQRLTGSTSSSSSSSSATTACSSSDPFNDHTGAISPAARFATIEKAAAKSPKELNMKQEMQLPSGEIEGTEMSQVIERSSLPGNLFPGILSPGPSSLPPISPNFFSPLTYDPNMLSFLHDLSPVVHGNRSFLEGSFMPSPSTPSMDLFNFNNIFDF